MSIKIVATVAITNEIKQTVMPMINALIEGSRAEAGCLKYEALSHDSGIIFVEEWADEAAIDIHKNMPHFVDFVTWVEESHVTLDIHIVESL